MIHAYPLIIAVAVLLHRVGRVVYFALTADHETLATRSDPSDPSRLTPLQLYSAKLYADLVRSAAIAFGVAIQYMYTAALDHLK